MGSGASNITNKEGIEIIKELKLFYKEKEQENKQENKEENKEEKEEDYIEIYNKIYNKINNNNNNKQIIINNNNRINKCFTSKYLLINSYKKLQNRIRSFEELTEDDLSKLLIEYHNEYKQQQHQHQQIEQENQECKHQSEYNTELYLVSNGLTIKDLEILKKQVDNWDSVLNQPSCLICGVVFPSEIKKNQHNQYSDQHHTNTLKLKQLLLSNKLDLYELPPSRYRIIYSGNKYYSNLNYNLDIYIYLHTNCYCIEIVCYDSSTGTEYPRIYLDEKIVLEQISSELITDHMNESIEYYNENILQKTFESSPNINKDKHEHEHEHESFEHDSIENDSINFDHDNILPPKHIFYEEEKRKLLAYYILSHLNLFENNKIEEKKSDDPFDEQIDSSSNIEQDSHNLITTLPYKLLYTSIGEYSKHFPILDNKPIQENQFVDLEKILKSQVYETRPNDVIPIYIPRNRTYRDLCS